MNCRALRYSRHAFERMFQRGIPPEAVEQLVAVGEVIATYPDDTPYPSALLLGLHDGEPFHAVVARDVVSGDCQVVTVYRPDPALWDRTYRSRKSS
jgi:hypothetical protein